MLPSKQHPKGWFQKIWSILFGREEAPSNDSVPNWSTTFVEDGHKYDQLFNHALQLVNEGKGEKAVSSFMSARKEMSESSHTLTLARMDHRLSAIYSALADNESALRYASQSVLLLEEELAKQNKTSPPYRLLRTELLSALVAYGMALEAKGDYQEALVAHRKATEIVRGFQTANKLSITPCLAGVGRCLTSLLRYEEAEQIWDEILSIRTEKLPAGHELIGIAQIQMGHLYVYTGQYGDARKMLEAGVLNAKNRNHKLQLAEGWGYLADLEERELHLDKSLEYCKQYIAVQQQLVPQNNISGWIQKQAQLLSDLGRLEESSDVLEKEVQRLEPNWNNSPADYVSTVCMLSQVWLTVGNLNESAKWLNLAEKRLRELSATQEALVGDIAADVLLQRARVLDLQLDFEKAVAAYRNVLFFFADDYQWRLAYSLPLGRALIMAKQYDEAIELLQVLSSEKYLRPDCRFQVHRALTRAFLSKLNIDKCSRWIEAAQRRLASNPNEQRDDCRQADYHIDLGLLAIANDKPDDAELEFKYAIDFVERKYGVDHPFLTHPLHFYREWCEARGKLLQAASLQERIISLQKRLEAAFLSTGENV